MGAGRKTKTIHVPEKSVLQSGIYSARNLRTDNLAAVIFGCKHNTIEECFSKELFGLPSPHIAYVKNIKPGLPLFLFNYSDRKLHGIFEAVCPGRQNIDSQAWTEDGSDCTPYSAQVKFRIQKHCQPLREDQFGPIIAQNYYEPRLFWFELDKNQANKLIALFSSSPMTQTQIDHQRRFFGSNARGKQQFKCKHASKFDNYFDDNEKEQNAVAQASASSRPSYSSVVKTWSSLFDKGTVPNTKNRTADSEIHSSELNNSYLDVWEPSSYTCQENVVSKARMGEDSEYFNRTADSEIHSLELNNSYLDAWGPSSYSCQENLASKARMGEDSENCEKETIGDSRHKTDEFGLKVDENNWPWSSSYVPLSWEENIEPEEVHKDGDLYEKEPKDNDLECEYSLYASRTNMILGENIPGDVAEVKSREAIVSSIQPPEIPSLVAKLLQEVQELKESQSVQSKKISWLEQELIKSRREIQQLKDGQKMLKSNNLNFGKLM